MKRGSDDNLYYIYLKRTYDLKCTNLLYWSQIGSMAKMCMIKYFNYCYKNGIIIFCIIQIQY
jgi:hypothetical protein